MSSLDQTSRYARREEPAQGVGAPIVRSHSGYLINGREPLGLSDRALGFVLGVCAVLMVGLGIAAVALTVWG